MLILKFQYFVEDFIIKEELHDIGDNVFFLLQIALCVLLYETCIEVYKRLKGSQLLKF